MKRFLSILLVVVMILTAIPKFAIPTKAINDPYYEEFGITYEQLFVLYPNYLYPSQETAVVNSLMNAYKAALGEYGDEHDFLPSFIYALDEGGKNILSSEILSQFGIGKSNEEKLVTETSEALMREILKTESELASVTSEISGNFKSMKSTYNIATSAGKWVFINDLKSSCKNLSDSEIDKMADSLFKEESKLMKKIDKGIEFWQLIVGIVELQELQEESICQLRDAMEDNSDFAKALDDLLAEIEKDPVAYMLEYYCTDIALELLSDAIEKTAYLIGRVDPSKLTVAVANIAIKMITTVYPGAMADEIYQTTLLSSYVSEFEAAITSYRTQFTLAKVKGELIGQDDIAEYKYLYNAYITTIRETLKSALDTAKTDGQRGNIQNAINLCNTFTYDIYILWCMTAVKADIDAGIIAAPGSVAGNASACVKGTYPSYGAVTITKDNANIMDRPCSVNTDVNAKKVETGALNAEYVVTGLCLNTADNYWYQVVTKAGETGYIYSGNCEHRAFLNDLSVSGLDVPTHISVGSRYYIRGTISTVYTNLVNISYIVYDQNGNKRTGGTVDVNGKTYVLDSSAIDASAEFNLLEAGTYHCVLEATVENYTATDCIREKLLLDTTELTVGNISTSSGSADSLYSVQAVINQAAAYLNGGWAADSCQAFVASVFKLSCNLNGDIYSSCCAHHNGDRYIDSGSRENIPLGACVYFGGCAYGDDPIWCNGVVAGHVGVYVGNNQIVHAWEGRIVSTTIDHVINCGYSYRGYGWYADLPLNSECLPVGAYDVATGGVNSVFVRGWAFDPDTPGDKVEIQVYMDGEFIGSGLADTQRTDVNAVYGCGDYHGFDITLPVSVASTGTYSVQVYAINTDAEGDPRDLGTKQVTITAHAHSYAEEVTKEPTCTEAGEKTFSCQECQHTYTEVMPAVEHNYVSDDSVLPGKTRYTCTNCGDTYEGYKDGWTKWSTECPEDVPANLIEEKVQYSYLDKEYITSTEDVLEGWTLFDTISSWGDYGQWSDWSDTAVSPSDAVEVEQRTVWGYYYYLCPHCGAHMHGYGTCYTWAGGCGRATDSSGARMVWGTTSWDDAGLRDWYGTGAYYTYIDGELVFKWADGGSKTQYRSRTREMVDTYCFYRWPDQWSDWSDEEITDSEDRQVKTQTVYRYYLDGLAECSYTVTFKNADGTVITTDTYHYGETVQEPAAPQRPDPFDESYVFVGWDKEITVCKGDETYTAVFASVWTPGDMNEDKALSDSDALYLLRHTLFPERYPVNRDADVNADGVVSDADALYLLRYTLFPERFPLYPVGTSN